ncbi:hypothetical protein HCN44_004933 [Aphidius gifuensis]|uniref:Uncharacterized protein n=1 Tax=Aphidius gifuensis TaxID=684658 RepID=A0A834XWS9_APHGI|nr:hypothetical protein HCN44_004933 [Aphidius gifuensis]
MFKNIYKNSTVFYKLQKLNNKNNLSIVKSYSCQNVLKKSIQQVPRGQLNLIKKNQLHTTKNLNSISSLNSQFRFIKNIDEVILSWWNKKTRFQKSLFTIITVAVNVFAGVIIWKQYYPTREPYWLEGSKYHFDEENTEPKKQSLTIDDFANVGEALVISEDIPFDKNLLDENNKIRPFIEGPFKIIERKQNEFVIDVDGKNVTIPIDRLLPGNTVFQPLITHNLMNLKKQ